ncbi:MAG: DUF819 family protein [Pseudomonadales bacterium]|nr:DUF819 family protein [Pseudomonadales bacterium]
MPPLIGPDQDFALWAVLLGLAAFGFWCERRPWGQRFSGVLTVISAAILLSNLRIIPTSAPVYDRVWDTLVPVAIALLLLQADLRRMLRDAGGMLVAFALGALTVVLGTLAGISLLPLGAEEAGLGGVFAATYIGGSLNFAAVSEATGIRDGGVLSAAVAADNVITNLHFLALLLISSAAIGPLAGRATPAAPAPERHVLTRVDLPGLLTGLALAFAFTALARSITDALDLGSYAILLVTLFAVAAGTLAPALMARCTGVAEAGNVLLFIFLASIGATADVWVLMERAPVLFLFALIIVSVHLAGLLLLGRLLRRPLPELLVASAACIGGPASGAALAGARGWGGLATPAVLAGSLGYAVGSFVGIGFARALAG